MNKPIHPAESQKEKQPRSTPQQGNLQNLESPFTQAGSELGLKGMDSLAAQANALNHIPPSQRPAAMARINQVQGNRHIQRLMAERNALEQRQTAPPSQEMEPSPHAQETRSTPPAALQVPIQPKLSVSEPGDRYELEADAVAEEVMRMPGRATPPEDPNKTPGSKISRLQRKGVNTPQTTPQLENQIQQMRGGGDALPDSERSFFEPRMGVDLSHVRIHHDSSAAQLNRSLQARAFTIGSDVAFNTGEYQPGTPEGRRLMAHELTHVVQQGGAGELQRKTEEKSEKAAPAVSPEEAVTKAKNSLTESDVNAEQEEPLKIEEPALPEVKVPEKGNATGNNGAENATATPSEKEPENKESATTSTNEKKTDPAENLNTVKTAQPETHNTSQNSTYPKTPAAGAVKAESAAPQEGTPKEKPAATPAAQPVKAESAAPQEGTPKEKPAATPAAQPVKAESAAPQEGTPKEKPAATPAAQPVKAEGAAPQENAPKEKPEATPAAQPVKAEGAAPQENAPQENSATARKTSTSSSAGSNATEGDKAPASPEEDPGFQAVASRSEDVAAQEETHEPAANESAEAQGAADPQGSDVEMAAQDEQVAEIEAQKPKEFNPEDFVAKLMEKIKETAPKNLKEAAEFKGNKLDDVKNSISGQVKDKKQEAEGPVEEKTKEEPDKSGIEPKKVEPLKETNPGTKPGPIGAEQAAPKPKGQSEVEAPMQKSAKSLDQQMADANVTEEQLQKSNEPEFQAALGAKKDAQAAATEGPASYRAKETATLTKAQAESAMTAEQKEAQMHQERTQLLQEVFGIQGETKTEDEAKRKEIAEKIAEYYTNTKDDVTEILDGLDGWVTDKFEADANAARDKFVSEANRRVNDFKINRYLCRPDGLILWGQDLFAGPPPEIELIYQEERENYIAAVKSTLQEIAIYVSQKLNEAKNRVAQGRQDMETYIATLDPALRDVGKKAAGDIQSKFDDLEQSVYDKQSELIDNLAEQYNAKLQEVDDEIEKMREENKGLIQKAEDAIKGVIDTIMELKNTLMDMLNRAAGAIELIIKDPVKFLGNLLEGVKMGFMQFVGNIGKHLQSALMGWLTGALGPAGITLPEKWDLQGIFGLVLQILGLTWANIRAQIVKGLGPNGEKIMQALETGWKIIQIIMTQGLPGLWKYIQDKIGDLKTMVLDAIQNMVIEQIIKTGVDWLISMLGGPAGAFVKAVQSIVRVVTWFTNNAGRIASLVNAVIDSVTNIANGNLKGAADFIENALAQALPTVIGFLADLLGLGGISEKIKGIINTVRKPVNDAIKWLVKQAKAMAKKVAKLLGLGKKDKKEKRSDQNIKAGIDALHSEERAQSGLDGISKEKATNIANSVKARHPIFKSITPIEGNKSWDYIIQTQKDKIPGEKPKSVKTQWGWSGGPEWKKAVQIVSNPGDHVEILGKVPTLKEAKMLLEEAGVTEMKIHEAHPAKTAYHENSHTYPHINYITAGGKKAALKIVSTK